jgi:hypothetical protein
MDERAPHIKRPGLLGLLAAISALAALAACWNLFGLAAAMPLTAEGKSAYSFEKAQSVSEI